jgi:type IV pilus assembly protein PilW
MSRNPIASPRYARCAQRLSQLTGFTLVELMVALAIGSFLLIGATTIYMQGRTSFRVNEAISRLQEDARYVLDTMEPDIRMASFFGLHARPRRIQGRATPIEPPPPGLGVIGDCGANWAINVAEAVGGANGTYDWAGCSPYGAGAQPDADTLVVRRAAEDEDLVLDAGTMYVQSARFRDSQLFVGTSVPPGFGVSSTASHRLLANGYYVSRSSDADAGLPSLRMKALIGDPGGPRIDDIEILSGVEDLQVQFGVDTDPLGTPNRGSVNRYVNPGDPMLDPQNPLFDANAQVIAVRIWLRIRADLTENGFTDDTNYVYADQDVAPINDNFRRILVSKTIYLRNARTMI